MKVILLFSVSVCIALLPVCTAKSQVRTYDVSRASFAPTIDGVVSLNEWSDAGAAQGDWGELLQLSPPDGDTAGNRFRMKWDSSALYLLYETNQTVWEAAPAEANPLFNFVDDQLYLYFDPNLDNEANFLTNPDEFVDGYELAFNQHLGTRVSTNANRNGVGFSTEARVDSMFGDQAEWNAGGNSLAGAALESVVVAQRNGLSGGRAEMRIPWTVFDANSTYTGVNPRGDYNGDGNVDAADYIAWRKTIGTNVAIPGDGADGNEDGLISAPDYAVWRSHFGESATVDTGLHHPFAPQVGDMWYYNMGQISTADPANFMPVYNWTEAFFFAAHPHAEITFVGPSLGSGGATVPEPNSTVLVMVSLGSLAQFIRARRASVGAYLWLFGWRRWRR